MAGSCIVGGAAAAPEDAPIDEPRPNAFRDRTRRTALVRLRRVAFPGHLLTQSERWLAGAFLALGAGLRLWQYFAGTSLWIDEVALARNIVERDAAALLRPLDYAQIAPPGFLLIEKAAVATLGRSEYVLRAFPLVCGLAALLLFTHAAVRVLSGWAVCFAIGLFAGGIPFIYFSSVLKQYSTDVAVALALLVATLDFRAASPPRLRHAWLLGLGGMAATLVSQTAVFVLAGLGAALGLDAVAARDRRMVSRVSIPPGTVRVAGAPVAIVAGVWTVAALATVVYSYSAVPHLDREYFQWFWRDGFMPLPPRTFADLLWLPKKLTFAFGAFAPGLGHTDGGLYYRWSPAFVAAMLVGLYALWRTDRTTAFQLVGPLIAVVVCSAASIYPFTARLTVFTTPYLLLATAAGVERIVSALAARQSLLGAAALAIFAGSPTFALTRALPPTRVQDLRPVLESVKDAQMPGDHVYVYYGAELAFRYYAPREHVAGDAVRYGGCHLTDPRGYLRELDSLRGAPRVWIVVTHAQRQGELQMILVYLDAIGRRLSTYTAPSTRHREIEDASAYLYDLSNRAESGAVSAETFPVALAGMDATLARWGCYGVTGGEPADRDARGLSD